MQITNKQYPFSNEFWQLCNMNTLTIKDLQKLQKYKYLYTTNNIDLSLFYNHTYTFPEFLSISLKNRKLIEIYNSLDPSMRVDENSAVSDSYSMNPSVWTIFGRSDFRCSKNSI